MHLSLALSPTPAGRFLLAALILAGLKVISFLMQLILSGGDSRYQPRTTLFRLAYATGKVAPVLSIACFLIAALLLRDRANSWFLGLWMVFVALLAAYVVRLRQRGKFYGVIDLITRNHERKS
jgi:cobalamin synthase